MSLVEIKPIGNYLYPDNRGYLVNRSNIQNNQNHWLATIETVKDIYLKKWKNEIHSIYIRGSIAKGIAIDRISDIDSFAIIKPSDTRSSESINRTEIETWEKESEEKLLVKFPFIAGLELVLLPFESIKNRSNIYNFTIKVQGVCIYGEDLADRIAPYRIDREIAFQTKDIHFHLEQFWSEYPNETEEEKKLWLGWLMKRFLRLGMEFVMEDEQLYTRDLYFCYQSFARYYPQQAEQMYFALELAIRPKIDRDTILFVRRFGNWLVAEASKKLHNWGYTQNEEKHWVFNS